MRALRLMAMGICLAWVWVATAGDAAAKKRRRRRPLMQRTAATNASLLTPSYSSSPAPISPPAATVETEAVLSPEAKNAIAASLVLQGDISYGPAAIGFAVDYQRLLSERWRLTAGVGVGLRQHRTLLQPHAGADLTFLSVSQFDFHASLGVAAPIQFMSGTAAIAVAGRGLVGAQWGLFDWLRPHAGVVVIAGPLMTPAHLRGNAYVALQMVIGSTFAF